MPAGQGDYPGATNSGAGARPRFAVLITDYAWPSLDPERAILGALGAELLVAETGAEEELIGLAPRADAILTLSETRLPEELPKMREVVQRMSVESLANGLHPLFVRDFHIPDRPMKNGSESVGDFNGGRQFNNQIIRILLG